MIHHRERKRTISNGTNHIGDGRMDERQRPDLFLDLRRRLVIVRALARSLHSSRMADAQTGDNQAKGPNHRGHSLGQRRVMRSFDRARLSSDETQQPL